MEVCDILDSQRIPIKQSERAQRRGNFPYYGASGIVDYVDDFLFDEDLILLSEDGANLVDRVTPVAFKVTGKIWVNNHAHVLRVSEDCNIDFIVEYLESISYLPFITGTAQPKLNQASMNSILLPIPPRNEQDAIAVQIQQINKTTKDNHVFLARIRDLKTKILDHYLEESHV